MQKQKEYNMVKKLLISIIVLVFTFIPFSPVVASEMEIAGMEQIDEPNINIVVNHSSLHITGAAGMVLKVVSLTGKPVAEVKIESPAQRVELNIPRGCYILKVGKIVRKVSIR